MTLLLHVHGGYPSYANSGASWRGIDYDAHMFIQTLKGNSINGYVDVSGVDGKRYRITTDKPNGAFHVFGTWAAKKIAELGLPPGYIVPVPSSSCIALNADEKGHRLASSVALHSPHHSALSALHWGEAMQKAALGGERDPDVLFGKLFVLQNLPPSNIVLLDDVVSTGGHVLASARALRAFGHTVTHVVAAAQTVWEYPPNGMFNIPSRDLERNPFDDDICP